MAFAQIHLRSDTLAMNEEIWAFLPEAESFTPPDRKFKTFWFLHGGSGDQTAGALKLDMERFAARYDLAVIMPNVHGSCYVNMARGPRYADYLGLELPRVLRTMFPFLSGKREDNIISGFSNGGYGAFHLALKFPGVFGYGGAFAAGDKADADFSGRPLEKLSLFGDGNLQETEYSVKHQARALAASGGPLPRFFHVCGETDPWHHMNKLVRECFEGIPGNPYGYAYLEVPGRGHDNQCWRTALENFAVYLGWEKD
jgi:S-formylglutathione hydrolase FrmB